MERLQEIATRKAELKAMLEGEEKVDLEEIRTELEALETEEKEINEKVQAEQKKAEEEAEERRKAAEKIAKGDEKAKEIKKEEKMDNVITRNSKEYIDAFAEYVKTGNDEEVRTLLTENVNGTIATPDFVYDKVKTAWDKNEIMQFVHKVELKGNLKVNFEISGSDAVVHLEGSEAVSEETLTEGIATIVPESIKKWISISDEAYDLRGEAFLNYIYDELTYRIVKKCADLLVAKIATLPDTATSTSPAADAITAAPAQSTVAEAVAHLSDEASNPVIIINKLTYAEFKKVQYAGNYGVDVFEGLKVVFNNTLPAYSAANANAVYAIVGDLGEGAIANFPNGTDAVEFKFDELSRKKEDLIEVLGRQYVGLGVVSSKAFTLVKKPSSSI